MNYAMSSGLILGLFWVIKYVVVVGAEQIPFLRVFTAALMFVTPLLLLYFLVRYRTQETGGTLRFTHGLQFTIMLFFFASILEAVVVYIHITWIDTAFVGNMYAEMVAALKQLNFAGQMAETLGSEPIPSGLYYIINHVVLTNVFAGMMLSLFLIPLSKRLNVRHFNLRKSE